MPVRPEIEIVDVEEEPADTSEIEGQGQLVLVVDDLQDMRNLIGSRSEEAWLSGAERLPMGRRATM